MIGPRLKSDFLSAYPMFFPPCHIACVFQHFFKLTLLKFLAPMYSTYTSPFPNLRHLIKQRRIIYIRWWATPEQGSCLTMLVASAIWEPEGHNSLKWEVGVLVGKMNWLFSSDFSFSPIFIAWEAWVFVGGRVIEVTQSSDHRCWTHHWTQLLSRKERANFRHSKVENTVANL